MDNNIIKHQDKSPVIHPTAYVNPLAIIMGDVTVGENTSIWPHCILRGDMEKIIIGNDVVLLDRTFIETTEYRPVTIDSSVLISHNAIIHGAATDERNQNNVSF